MRLRTLAAALLLCLAFALPARAGTTLASEVLLGCPGSPTQFVVSSASLTSATKIITGTASKQTYLCDVTIVAPNNTVAFGEGTGTNCGTGNHLLGTTATTFAASGGFVLNNATAPGVGLVKPGLMASTATAADDVCVIAGSATQVTIYGWYIQQ